MNRLIKTFVNVRTPALMAAGLLMVLLSACNLPAIPTETPTAGPFPIPTVELLDEPPTPEATLVIAPVVTETAVTEIEPTAAEAGMPDIVYEGISFSYPDDLAASVDAQTIAAQTDGANTAPWDLLPEYAQFTFNDYVLPDTFHTPHIYVYPVDGLQQIMPNGADVVQRLQQALLAQDTHPANGLPFMPPFNAAQIITAKVAYVDFQNGHGVRYLTEYGQDIRRISSYDLFYTFQGLTDDGLYYVAAIFPTRNAVLPDTSEMTQEEYQDLADGYLQYIDDTVALLNGQPDGSFTPGLDVLDALVHSVWVEK